MFRSLLLGAFATAAFGAECKKDISAMACKNFAIEQDFDIQNDASDSTIIKMTVQTKINGAISYIGDAPWNREDATYAFPSTASPSGTVSGASGGGCTYADRSAAGDTATSHSMYTTNRWSCDVKDSDGTTCGADGTTLREEPVTMTTSIAQFVSGLDSAGRYPLYFQRVLENPIQSGGNLEWIAENACKVYVDVDFECTGGNCVTVTTIVCASFAGITTGNGGLVAIECKVPNGFQISSTDPAADADSDGAADGPTTGANVAEENNDHSSGISAASVWPGTTSVTNGFACTNGNGNAVCAANIGTATGFALGTDDRITGDLVVTAWVRQGASGNFAPSQELHRASYNLTRASDVERTFNLAVNVLFYSDASATQKDRATVKGLDEFSSPNQQRPFLAKSTIDMGSIVNHNHGYFSVVAQVDAASAVFSNLRVTKIVHDKDGDSTNDEETENPTCNTMVAADGTTVTEHDSSNYPFAYLVCPGLMSGALDSGSVEAGHTLVASLKWKLVQPSVTGITGKAALLQDGATEAQSVEVSLTIQLGGGETTITTAGGSDGSSDPTVTYIIIAVCIVAAGLILAVVVVAFMCLRNRSQEQMVSMSPQKCTVAAVYDISQPKKADAMDV